jgi:hypothetical protein
MDENRSQEQAVPAEQPQEAQRSVAGLLAQDLNTIATSVAATYVAAKVITKGSNQDPPPPEADPPS